MQQEPRPFLIGERLNTQGSASFKQFILAEDFDGALTIARQQVNSGAHGLDLCVALTERADEVLLMQPPGQNPGAGHPRAPGDRFDRAGSDRSRPAGRPRTLPDQLHQPGKRAGQSRPDLYAGPAQYNAAVICLTIDEQGMAKTAERKLEIARRIYSIAVEEYGLLPGDLVFDALTFTLATGDPEFNASAVETLEGIRLIKRELPGVLTSLGVSNVSFGLSPAARAVINSVMLYHCVQAGLDMAIVNPAQITPYCRNPRRRARAGRRPDLQPPARCPDPADPPFSKPPARPRRTNQPAQKQPWKACRPSSASTNASVTRLKEGIEADIDEILQRRPRAEWSAGGRGYSEHRAPAGDERSRR